MSDQARLFGTVLYELKLPGEVLSLALQILGSTKELPAVLSDPSVPLRQKLSVISRVFPQPDFPVLFTNFLKKVCEAGCIDQLNDIVSVSRTCALERAGILEARLYSVTKPDEAQIAGIKEFLCRKHRKKAVELTLCCDPDLIGGFLLKAGDLEYDYSLKGRFLRLSRAVTG